MQFGRLLGTRKAQQLWSGRLWILSAALGMLLIATIVATVHDDNDARAATHVVLAATATQVAMRANFRLESRALHSFAPALSTHGTLEGNRDVLRALVDMQRVSNKCLCMETLPAIAFFRVDLEANGTALAMVDERELVAVPTLAMLSEVATRHANTLTPGSASNIRWSLDRQLGDLSVVSLLQPDSTGRVVIVYGAIAQRTDLATQLFAPELEDANSLPSGSLARLRSGSLRATASDSSVLFGGIDSDDRTTQARVVSMGTLNNVIIDVSADPSQMVLRRLVTPLRRDRLWQLGLILLATVLVIVIAVGVSRRETALARTRTDFVAGVSHDLRMPLAQILLAGESLSLQRERDVAERLRYANSIVREARRLVGLVDNILLFSQTGAVELTPRLQAVAVDVLFDDLTASVALAIEDAEQSLVVDTTSGLIVLGDRGLLQQALLNLVDNAMKYGRQSQRIAISAVEHPSGMIRLYVDDEGTGVPISDRKAVFEPYVRIPNAGTPDRTGSGLGLVVVQQIVKACRGRVWFEDAPGGGARVVLELQNATSARSTNSDTPDGRVS